MKLIVFTAVLCALVATGFAQTKSPNISKMQNALGSLLGLVKDLTVATNQVVSDTNVQAALKSAQAAIADIKNLYTMYGTTYTSSVPLSQRNKLNSSFTTFKNAITGLETALGQFPLSPSNIINQLTTLHNAFLALGGSVVPL